MFMLATSVNCETCIHKKVCGNKETIEDVDRDVANIAAAYPPETPIEIRVKCVHYEEIKPAIRAGLKM